MKKNTDNFTNWTKTEIFSLFALVIANFGAIGGLAVWVDSRISDSRREILKAIKADKIDTDQKVSTLDSKFSTLQNTVINGLVSQKR